MEIPPTASAANPAPRDTVSALSSQFAEANKDNFPKLRELASVILDTSGTYSDDAKIEAWRTQFQMAVTGQFRGAGAEDADLINQISRSDTSQQIEADRVRYADAMMAAVRGADAAGQPREEAVGRAALKHFDGLSQTDQRRLFASINAPDRTGSTPYQSVDDWRAQMINWAKLFAPISDTLDLSADAKKVVGNVAGATNSPPYKPGSNASLTA